SFATFRNQIACPGKLCWTRLDDGASSPTMNSTQPQFSVHRTSSKRDFLSLASFSKSRSRHLFCAATFFLTLRCTGPFSPSQVLAADAAANPSLQETFGLAIVHHFHLEI